MVCCYELKKSVIKTQGRQWLLYRGAVRWFISGEGWNRWVSLHSKVDLNVYMWWCTMKKHPAFEYNSII